MVIKDNLTTTLDEFHKAEDLLSVWVIFKDGDIAGRIMARCGKQGVVHVALIFYGKCTGGQPIYGYQRMTGHGYDKVNSGIADILVANKQKLSEAFNLTLDAPEWQVMNTWKHDLEACGFQVFQAI